MAYFKIGTTDLSAFVSGLKVNLNHQYIDATNAAGETVVDYIRAKRVIEVTFIPLLSSQLVTIEGCLAFQNTISFMNPKTNALETGVNTILPNENIAFQTIQTNNKEYKSFTLSFYEL